MPPIDTLLKKYKDLIISVVILLFCAIGFIGGVAPAAQKVQGLFDQTQQLSSQTKALRTKLTALNALDESVLRNQLNEVIAAVPSDKSLPTVFSTVEGIAGQAGVSIANMSIGGDASLATPTAAKRTAQEKQLGTRTIPFSVTIEGTPPAIQQFIALAPQVRRLLRIRTFAITFPSNDRPVHIAVEMDAFYEPFPGSIGKTGSALPILSDKEVEIISMVSKLPMVNSAEVALPPPLIGQTKPDPFAP